MIAKKTGKKGIAAEESLRHYFRGKGYFVVRSIPLVYKGYDVTDVDLWLYAKPTSLSAERTCVDVKRRRTPQALERVLWTKGLKEVLGLERALVVTSDNRSETREFGGAHGVGILQGAFLQQVVQSCAVNERLSEEELFEFLRTPCVADPDIEWRAWFRRLKARLLVCLDFDGCNTLVLAANQLLQEYRATGKASDVSVRLLYAVVAFFLVCLDYAVRSCVSLEASARKSILTEGFRYGEAGRERTEEVVQMALQLLADAGKTDLFSGDALRDEFDRQVSEYPAEVLGEHFAKTEQLKRLFTAAQSFESLAYAKALQRPHELPTEEKSIIGLLCDLLKHDRKEII